ncbi:MAG: NADPH-dependent oxidoreductase [Planctomycetes bacterium]|nr:NADPH-dependent oxidoreductase [Planctomycetota bacterium]
MTSNLNTKILDTLMAHVSVRAFRDEPLPDGVLEKLVEAGTRASTSSNMQAYTVIAVTDPPLKKQLAKLCADQPQIHQSAMFLVFCADLHKLTLCCRQHGTMTDAVGVAEALLIAVIDAALVMQNVAVAAESLGLGICMIGAMRNHPIAVADLLHLPANVFAISGFCIGYPADDGEVKPRLPLAATLHTNRYRGDDELRDLISSYDETLTRWYAEHNMHPKDPRWSAVMAKRLPAVARRAEVADCLRQQGFLAVGLASE